MLDATLQLLVHLRKQWLPNEKELAAASMKETERAAAEARRPIDIGSAPTAPTAPTAPAAVADAKDASPVVPLVQVVQAEAQPGTCATEGLEATETADDPSLPQHPQQPYLRESAVGREWVSLLCELLQIERLLEHSEWHDIHFGDIKTNAKRVSHFSILNITCISSFTCVSYFLLQRHFLF